MQTITRRAPEGAMRRVCPEMYATRLFLLCCMMYIIGVFGRMSYSAVAVELITSEGFTKSQAGLIGTALFAAYGACQILSGFLGDKIPPRKMVFAGVFGSAVLNLGMGTADDYRGMLVLWAANGVFQSFIWPPVFKVFSEVLPPSYRKRACANAAATNPIATVLTYLFAAFALHALGWRSVFLLSGALMAAASFYWLRRMAWYEREIGAHGQVEHITLTPQEQASGGSLMQVLAMSGVLYALIAAVTHGMLRDGIQAWVPTFMTENFRFGASISTAMAVLLPLVNITGVFLTKFISRRWIRNELNGTAAFFAVDLLALAALAALCRTSAAGSLIMMMLASTCMIGANVMLINIMPIHFGAIGRASTVTGVLNCSAYIGSALSSYGIGKVADLFGWQAAVCVWLGFSAVSLVTALLGARRWGRYRRQI